jgi:hypothetical protein
MLSIPRILVALAVGFIGCLFIWVAAPYNNFFLRNSFISDTYFPVSGVIFMLVIVLGVNSLLRLIGRHRTLNGRQLILVFSMLLAAAVIPSQGLLRMLPWALANTTQHINQQEVLNEAFESAGVPHALFPDEIGFGVETPASNQFLDELEPDQSIPWANWVRLLPVWGTFLLACWLLMIGTGLVLFPEWREKERLPFPLLDVYRSILPDEGSDQTYPSMFRSRGFWLGAGAVMIMYAMNGLNHHTHDAFPGFPMGWQLSSVFSEPPWRFLSGSITNVRHIYFVLVGMAFFMPNRVGFSIWSITVGYALFEMIQRAYFQPYYGGMVTDHRNGAMVAVTVMVLFISRRHWLHVAKVMFITGPTDDTDRMLRSSGWMIVIGAIGMFLWLQWANVPAIWAAIFVLIGFMVSVLIARIVAETGLPFVRITGMNAWYFMSLVPGGWLTGAAIYMAGFISIIFQIGSRVSAAVMISHAAGLDRKASPKHQLRLGYMMIGIFVIGLIVCGAIHLYMGYTQPYTMDGMFTPINEFGTRRMHHSENLLIRWTQDYWVIPANRLGHLIFGFVFAGALQIACMRSPRWPLHPVGLLLVGHYYGTTGWASIMIGWALKVSIINIGGATVFRKAQPLFMGLILGEILSAVIWTIVPVILLMMGHDPSDVGHIPLLPT